MRIISLVPSLTELLYHLGLGDAVVGITKFCIHPTEWHQSKRRVGGTKNVHLEIIHQLQPTLIIASKEENVEGQINILSMYYPVLLTDINTYQEALEAIELIGHHTQKQVAAKELVANIQKAFTALEKPVKQLRVAYLIWKEPYMAAANNTFIHDMLLKAGFINMLMNEERYPEVSIETLQQLQPDVIMLSSEPYPFTQKQIDALQPNFPNTKIILVDGEMFSWYGSRMLEAATYITRLQALLNQ